MSHYTVPEIALYTRDSRISIIKTIMQITTHERLPEILVVPREKTPTGAAARGNP